MADNNQTLKLVSSQRAMGPQSQKDRDNNRKSAAVRKIAFNNNLKVEFTSDEAKASQAKAKSINNSTNIESNSAEHAIEIFLAWDTVFPSTMDEEYKSKLNEYKRAQSDMYAIMGITIPHNGSKPYLSIEQREMYNEEMRKHSFKYFTTSISYKDGKHHAVRTKTYKSLQPVDRAQLLQKLEAAVKKIGVNITISAMDEKPKATLTPDADSATSPQS